MPLLEVKNLHTFFTTKKGIVKAVNDVSYTLDAGKTIGIVGESGSGKSVSAMSILRLLDGNGYIESGEILLNGRDLTKVSTREMNQIRGNDISVIFQEPMTSLNPVFSVDRQLSEPFMIHQGMTKKEAHREALKMLYDVQIPNPEVVIKQYPHQLSGGMRQRVMIAMALACKPKILIADEPTTALDVTIQAQILKLMNDLKETTGTAHLQKSFSATASAAIHIPKVSCFPSPVWRLKVTVSNPFPASCRIRLHCPRAANSARAASIAPRNVSNLSPR